MRLLLLKSVTATMNYQQPCDLIDFYEVNLSMNFVFLFPISNFNYLILSSSPQTGMCQLWAGSFVKFFSVQMRILMDTLYAFLILKFHVFLENTFTDNQIPFLGIS